MASEDVDAYIAAFPGPVQVLLSQIRATVLRVAPEAEEMISYQIPSFKFNGRYLVYFAGWKKHLSIYPLPSGDAEFQSQLGAYQTSKGTVQFPLDAELPISFIENLVRFRIQENPPPEPKAKPNRAAKTAT